MRRQNLESRNVVEESINPFKLLIVITFIAMIFPYFNQINCFLILLDPFQLQFKSYQISIKARLS